MLVHEASCGCQIPYKVIELDWGRVPKLDLMGRGIRLCKRAPKVYRGRKLTEAMVSHFLNPIQLYMEQEGVD